MLIGQIGELKDSIDKRKEGRCGKQGGYFHYEFCLITSKSYHPDRYSICDFNGKLPITQMLCNRFGYSVLINELNNLGDFDV